jgi:Tfp pilus assembly PilM family ATPase
LAVFESQLETADRLAAGHRFLDATAILKPIAAAEHSHLADAADRAKSRLLFCGGQQLNWAEKVRAIEVEIPQLLAAGKIDAALRKIHGVPANLRSPGLIEILDGLEKNRNEIAELSRIIFQAAELPPVAELMAKVARLLELQPSREDALKKARVLKLDAMREAKTLAQNGDYEKAWETVNGVPEAFRDEEFLAFRSQIGDLAYWAWDVVHAPLADGPLFDFTRRLSKFLPAKSELKATFTELAKCELDYRKTGLVARRTVAAPTSPFSAPVEPLRDFGPIDAANCAGAAALAENPGRFAVACGLALQGLGVARLEVNLMPEDSWRDKIGRWLQNRKIRSAWGIEIGTSGIKAVKLANDSLARKSPVGQTAVSLADCRIVEHRRRLLQSTNDRERDSLLEETLQAFVEQNAIGDDPVVLGLPDWMTLIKTVELPPMPMEKREAAIAHEIRHVFPMLRGDVLWRHARFDADDAEPQKRPFTVAYIGVRHALLKELLARWRKAGIRIAAVQCDMAALYNLSAFCGMVETGDSPAVFVDLGANRLNVLACSPTHFWHRSVMYGSDQINKALVREFKLTYAQAEQWKRNPTLATSIGRYYETLQPIYDIYVEETLNSLAAYRKLFPGETFSRLMGCGGGFAAHDLPRYFLWRK